MASNWGKRRRLRTLEHTYYHVNVFEYECNAVAAIDAQREVMSKLRKSHGRHAESCGDAFIVPTPDLDRYIPDPEQNRSYRRNVEDAAPMLEAALARLPAPEREAVEWWYSGARQADIADREKITQAAVSFRIKRAMEKLRAMLGVSN